MLPFFNALVQVVLHDTTFARCKNFSKYENVHLSFQSKSVSVKVKIPFFQHILDVLLTVLCRLISRGCRLWVLEADRVVQVIPGVVGLWVVVRVREEGHFLLNGSRWRRLLHWLLFLFLLHRRRRRRRWGHHNLPLNGPGWVVNQAVGVPVGIAVVLHAFEGADGDWGRLFDENWWRWRWGRLFWWRGRRLGHYDWFWRGFLRGAVGMVAGVAEHRHGAGGQVDDVGLAEGVLLVAQVEDVSLGDGWWRRRRRLCGLGDPFHRRWRWRWGSGFALLVCSWVTHDHWHSQFALEIGGVGAVSVLQVPHLLVEHPQLVDLIELRGKQREMLKGKHIPLQRSLIRMNQCGT